MSLHSGGMNEKSAFCPRTVQVGKLLRLSLKFIDYVVWFVLLFEQKEKRLMFCVQNNEVF